MDNEMIVKIVVAAFVGGGGFFLTVRHMFIAYINKNKEKKLRFKNGNGEVITQGDISASEAKLIKEFFNIHSINQPIANKQLPESSDD